MTPHPGTDSPHPGPRHLDAPDSPAASLGAARLPPLATSRLPRAPGSELLTDDDVLDHLVGLVGAEADGPASVWFALLDGHRVLPVVIPVADLPTVPEPRALAGVVAFVSDVIAADAPGACAAVAVVRAEGGDHGAFERRWAHALWGATADAPWDVVLLAAVGRDRARVLDRSRCAPALG